MKHILILLVLVVLVLGVTGCTQSSPSTVVPAPSHTVAITKSPVTPQKTAATTKPTPIPVPTEVQTATVSDNTVIIGNGAFDPQVITVKAGATVRWQNTDAATHRLKFVDGYTTQVLSDGQSCSKIFPNPGVFDYTDMMNPGMHGTVMVV
jgi:plastocyanin